MVSREHHNVIVAAMKRTTNLSWSKGSPHWHYDGPPWELANRRQRHEIVLMRRLYPKTFKDGK